MTNSITDFHMADLGFREDVAGEDTFYSAGTYAIALDVPYNMRYSHQLMQTFRLLESRIVRVLEGHAKFILNLESHELRKGDVLILPSRCIMEIESLSDDYHLQILTFEDKTLSVFAHDIVHLHPDEQEWNEMTGHVQLIWQAIHHKPLRSDAVIHLYAALLCQLMFLAREQNETDKQQRGYRSRELFRLFLQLVNTHCREQRNVAYYAELLCISPHYLSSVVKQESGKSATTWINRAITLEAKLLLRHSNLLVNQISDELSFPNPAFFNKFFKREVGVTPGEFRKAI